MNLYHKIILLQQLDKLTYERAFINKLEGSYNASSIRQ